MRPTPFPTLAALAALASLSSGCFNDAFQTNKGLEGPVRFDVLIEPDRTLVDGTHFLVDRATGDLWRLDVRDRRTGVWVRLADGPGDAAALDSKPEEEVD